jgi:hypothetical protein
VNPRATIALFLATLLAVGGLVYLRTAVDPTRTSAEKRRYAAVFEPGEITEIGLVRGNETIRLRRTDGGWRVTEPVEDRADPELVDRLLLAARFLDVRDREAAKDPAAVPESGLATPRVRLDLRGARDVRLDLGGPTALPGEIFARVAGQPFVLRVPDTILEVTGVPAESFRDPRLTELSADDIEKFTVQRADGELTVRLERGRWLIEKPVQAPADPRAVRDFLERFLGLRVTAFAADSGAAGATLPGQAARLALTPRGGGEELAVEISRAPAAEKFTARFAPRGGTLDVAPAAALLFDISPEALRDRSLGYVEADTIDRIVVEADGETAVIGRRGDGWTTGDGAREIETGAVTRLLEVFNGARVASFAPSAGASETGLEKPAIRLRFYSWLSENSAEEPAGGHLLAGVEFGRTAPDGNTYARAEGTGETVTVGPEILAEISALAGLPSAPAVNPAD